MSPGRIETAVSSEPALVIGRISAAQWELRTEAHRSEVRHWLMDNCIDPHDVPLQDDVLVLLIDAPVIRRTEVIRDARRRLRVYRDEHGEPQLVTRVVVTRLWAPLPEHLNDQEAGT